MTQAKMRVSDDSTQSSQKECASQTAQIAIQPSPARPNKTYSPPWQQQVRRCVDTIATPLSAASSAIGLHGFTPLPLEKEFARAAEVLSSLTSPASETPKFDSSLLKPKARQSETIPPSVIKSAIGIVILTTGRLGLRRVSGSAGAGVLLVRDTDNSSWYAPVGVRSYGAGAGPFALGLEVTDRVYILSSHEALRQFIHAGFLMGPEASLAAGRLCRGGGVAFAASLGGQNSSGSDTSTGAPYECPRCGHSDVHQADDHGELKQTDRGSVEGGIRESLRNPIQCYIRSVGLYVGLQAEASILEERTRDNADFYGRRVSVFGGATSLKEMESSLGPEKLTSLKGLLDVVSRAESREERDKLE